MSHKLAPVTHSSGLTKCNTAENQVKSGLLPNYGGMQAYSQFRHLVSTTMHLGWRLMIHTRYLDRTFACKLHTQSRFSGITHATRTIMHAYPAMPAYIEISMVVHYYLLLL